MNAHTWIQGLLDVAGSQPKGGKVRQCPAHRDRHPSLSVRAGRDGQAVIKCFSGCTLDEIMTALRIKAVRLSAPPPVTPARYAEMTRLTVEFPPVILRTGSPESRGYRLQAVHDYGPDARLLRYRNRGGDKELAWESRPAGGAWVPGFFGGVTLDRLPLYRETEVRQGMALGEPILLVESESSADALCGLFVTTWPGGVDCVPAARLAAFFAGYPALVLIPDNDPPGRRVVHRLTAAGLTPPVLWPAEGEDARDLYTRLGPAGFARMVADALRKTSVAA